MIAFMGSDAHNLRHRTTNLKDAREKLVKHWGEATATELLETKPRYILENKELPPELYVNRLPETLGKPKAKVLKKQGFFARLFG
jgi:tyrosine-protein phosphatase YwqE